MVGKLLKLVPDLSVALTSSRACQMPGTPKRLVTAALRASPTPYPNHNVITVLPPGKAPIAFSPTGNIRSASYEVRLTAAALSEL